MDESVIENRIRTQEVKNAVLDEKLKKLTHDIMGNGQPGAIQKLEAKIDDLKKDQDKQYKHLDEKLGRVMVAMMALGAGSGVAGTKLLEFLF